MRLARKLFLLGTMALAALAFTAGPASALEVHSETGSPCGTVTKTVHSVSGGCHLEFESEGDVPLVAYLPAPTTISNCHVHLEAHIGENGAGWIDAAALTPPSVGPVPCTREPCDEAGGGEPMLPWAIAITETSGSEEISATFCLRSAADPEGTAGTQCQVHLAINSPALHEYEFGGAGETRCESFPSPPVAINNAHFEAETGSLEPTVEIVH